jgi:hypothetical protein
MSPERSVTYVSGTDIWFDGGQGRSWTADASLFRAVVIQGYQLILQGIALKTCLILSSLLEPKWSQSVQNLSLPRFASNRNGFYEKVVKVKADVAAYLNN